MKIARSPSVCFWTKLNRNKQIMTKCYSEKTNIHTRNEMRAIKKQCVYYERWLNRGREARKVKHNSCFPIVLCRPDIHLLHKISLGQIKRSRERTRGESGGIAYYTHAIGGTKSLKLKLKQAHWDTYADDKNNTRKAVLSSTNIAILARTQKNADG